MFRVFGPIVFLLLFALWLYTIVSVIKTPDHMYRAGTQVVWLLAVILVPMVGVPLYWILGSPQTR